MFVPPFVTHESIVRGDDCVVVQSAPRYDDRIFDLVRALDDRDESMAEICRRVGRAADRLGVTRPSYVHLRRVIRRERARQDDLREIVNDVARDLMRGFRVDAYEVADRVREAGA